MLYPTLSIVIPHCLCGLRSSHPRQPLVPLFFGNFTKAGNSAAAAQGCNFQSNTVTAQACAAFLMQSLQAYFSRDCGFICTHDPPAVRPAQRISGSADQRISGSADQRISGSADQRISGSADQRTSGPADQRISGSADQRISGSADQRISGSADQWISGSADQRTVPRDPRISSSTDSAKCYLFVLVNCFPHTRLPFAHCRFIPQEIVPLTS